MDWLNKIGLIKSLRKSEQLATQRKAILESATGVSGFALDQNYQYTEFTRSHQETMCQIWGQEIAVGVNILEVMTDPADRAKAKANFDRVLQGEHLQLEEEYGNPSSKRAHYENRYNPIHDATGAIVGLTVFVIDITTRRQLESDFYAEQKLVHTLIDNLPDVIYFKDLNSRFLHVNRALALLFGQRNPADLIGKSDADYLPADFARQTLADELEIIRTGQPKVEIEEKCIYPDGREAWTLTTKLPLRDSDGKIIGTCGISSDITARKQAELHIRHLASIVEASDDCIVSKDLNGIITSWNKGAEKILGYSASEMIGTSILQIIPPDHESEEKAILEKIKRGESLEHFETQRVTKDHRMIAVSVTASPIRDSNNQIVGVSKTIRDITAQKRIEEQLRLQGHALTAADNGIVITDAEGVILWVNTGFTLLTGYSANETLGSNPRVLKSNQHDQAFYRQMWNWIKAGRVWQGEIINKHKDGHLYTEEMTITPVRSEQGIITNFIAIKQDITIRKKLEESLRYSQLQILQQEKLRGLGQMAAGIAHDFNNALSPIIGFSELLLKHPEKRADDTQVMKWLQNIHTCATDAAEVVRRMRTFGRQEIGAGAMSLVDLNRLALQTIEFTQPAWKTLAQAGGSTIQIATNLNPIPLIPGEESGLREILTNLILNAVQALPMGGTITLSTAVEADFVRLQVNDTGIGMTDEVRQRCLEPFFTTKSDQGGTGLGLAMANSIVQHHHGTLEIESTLGLGTTITIHLPIPSVKPPAIFLTETSALSHSLAILLVDDQPDLLDVVTEYLTTDGHTVTSATSGIMALTQVRGKKFDLVITDRAMPEMNGEQLAIGIHKLAPELPVILLTGFGDLMKANGEMPPDIQLILSKPVTQAALRDALAKVFPPAH